uniref:hypothetical protein n=1 Tax=Burkholderia gladioli TaxID=28095 RepID=UPI002FE229D7
FFMTSFLRWKPFSQVSTGPKITGQVREYSLPPPACLGDKLIVEGEYSGNAQEASLAIEPFIAKVFDAGHLSR